MRLEQLLKGLEFRLLRGEDNTEIRDIKYDSRRVEKGDAFICIRGEKDEGSRYIPQAFKRGAAAVVLEKGCPMGELPEKITAVEVESARRAMALMSAEYFGHPAGRLKLIGITGTKGKTTTAYILRNILMKSGKKTGLMGTVEIIAGDEAFSSVNTTPESYDIHRYLKKMADKGCAYAVMEVSSQGIKMERTGGMNFDYGVFTNLSPDHIGPGEHSSFREYAECKRKFFRSCATGVFNADDERSGFVSGGSSCGKVFFSLKGKGDINGEDIRLFTDGGALAAEFDLRGLAEFRARINMPGTFSVYNSLGAAGVCILEGVDEEHIKEGLETAEVRGRSEMIPVPGCLGAVIDYAHNEVSVRSILKTLREYGPERIIAVFGCGGNRPAMRREAMGEAVGELADLSIVTCDNPRFEALEEINRDIIRGLRKKGADYRQIDDRREAIEYAVAHAGAGDLIAVLGKGHENYMEIQGKRQIFSDKETLERIAESGGNLSES
ncbi:MAG TPA: UDP-N-acetylmuramoyl-L-alanyl-D-glutamate--2,6-diaminopimelate ligase [Candidatus Copromorpha excrementigallinarum]|uniref:UDP-N-acetylmuramoyl-L-alanyl-D-glutamate--2,6-diaminopimelate ligase n=1 Tax=Candidatus Allocopromorpha excrementigallinarum TaxID=2840742 RepID=A0A9D1I0W3_9FIRM|nr:UDP-N-acetylmuramoyl-L-alanyl-D-glutamate--2,6-diaminopimelate ligase [Candidatus Copromorpha excrementigallinarum]